MPDVTLEDLRVENPGAAQATASQAGTRDAAASTIDSPSGFSAYEAEASSAGSRDAAAAAGATRDATAQAGTATGYNAQTGVVDPNMTAAGQVAEITSQDNQYMRRAREAGTRAAARRGLGNSSISAGAAQGAAIDRATPLAQQDASTWFQNMRANTDAENRAREVTSGRETEVSMQGADLATRTELANAAASNQMEGLNVQLETDVNMANAQAENRMAELNAQLETAVSQSNAEAQNRIQQQLAELQTQIDTRNAELQTQTELSNAEAANAAERLNAELETNVDVANAQARNDMEQTVIAGTQRLNEQFLAGTQAVDIEAIRGRYNQLISSNQSAAQIYDSYLTAVSNMMANPEVTPSRVATYVSTLGRQMEGGLELIDSMNTIDWGAPATSVAPAPAPGAAPAPPPAAAPTAPPPAAIAPPPAFTLPPNFNFDVGNIGLA